MPIVCRLVLACFALLLALGLPAHAQPFQIEPVFLPDTPLPLPGTGWQVYALHENDAGQLVIGVVRLGSPDAWAVLQRIGTTIEVVAQQGDPAPELLGGTFDEVYALGITSSGEMVLMGTGCVEVPEWACSHGIYRATSAGRVAIALTGQSVPGIGGRTFSGIQPPHNFAVGTAGHVVFGWILDPDSIRGFFVADGSGVAPFALEGDPAPGTPHSFTTFFLHEPRVNATGEIAFEAGIQWSPLETGLFLREAGGTRAVMLPGTPAPGGGTLSGGGQRFALNDVGDVAFDATLTGGGWGVFVDSDGSLREIVRTGQSIPGTPYAFQQVHSPVIDEHGTVAFYHFDGEQGHPRGIYAEVGSEIVPVVLDGTPAPPGVPGTLLDVSSPTLGAGEDILFSAQIGDAIPAQVGFFRARLAPQVPTLGAPAAVLLAATLLASARLRLRARSLRAVRGSDPARCD